MSHNTVKDIVNMVRDEDVAFIRLQFTDIFGTLKNVAITPSQLLRALSGKVMFDGSAIEGFVRIDESDMFLVPDLDTFAIFPWRPQRGKVARMICDVYKTDKTPFEGDPRFVLKKAIAEAEKDGYTLNVGTECEFFLFRTDDEAKPTTETNEQAGYFDLGPVDFGENARRDIVLTLEEMGFEIETSHHEGAPAQHEIDFHYDEALKTADNIMTFKLAVRTIARQHGLHATFMPKPRAGVDGSGMHLNFSLHDKRDGRNLFANGANLGSISEETMYFIGGIMQHIKGMSAILNPIVNSYKRLIPGYEAPVYISWGAQNRTPLIRIPYAEADEGLRIELRSPDPAANPYLALAACLMAGLDGIRNKIMPPEPITGNVAKMTDEERAVLGIGQLPGTLIEAIGEFERDAFVREVLGEHISVRYIEAGKREWDQYSAQVTEWEIAQYLNKL
ncbi:MAG: type I glutamate--ammonia ligase [Lachnospiraceae bacterium]|nr:type I glutamate--ammonia ligase [Lachnospiraceae bacterium]